MYVSFNEKQSKKIYDNNFIHIVIKRIVSCFKYLQNGNKKYGYRYQKTS
jgi:hypothetical protein